MNKLPWVLLGVAITAIPAAIAATVMFSDVSEDDWYYEAVQNLQELGIVEGYEDETYRAENNVNRAEMAVMMDRLIDYIDEQYGSGALISEQTAYLIASVDPNCTREITPIEEAEIFLDSNDEGGYYWIIEGSYLGDDVCEIDAQTGEVLRSYTFGDE